MCFVGNSVKALMAVLQAPLKHRDASVQVKENWEVIEDMDFPRLTKLSLPSIEEGEDL